MLTIWNDALTLLNVNFERTAGINQVARLARRAATAERARVAQDIALKKGTLGSFGVQRFGNRIFESWEDGLAFQLKRQRKQVRGWRNMGGIHPQIKHLQKLYRNEYDFYQEH